MSISLTREQLYLRVWEKPIDTLRKKFGISNVGSIIGAFKEVTFTARPCRLNDYRAHGQS